MKSLFTIFSLFIILSCASQKTSKENLKTTSTYSNETLNILYEAKTRGSSKFLHVLENTVTLKTNTETKTITLSSDQEKEIKKALDKINLEEIKYLKSPNNKRMFDGAMHAVVKIKKNNKEYSSSNFDDGHPPEELQNLVDLLFETVK